MSGAVLTAACAFAALGSAAAQTLPDHDPAPLIARWTTGLKELGLDEHHRFITAPGAPAVLFESLSGRLGTFDRARNACLFDESAFAGFLKELADAGVAREEAARLLAAKSLPTFAHVVRDAILSAERKAGKLDYDGGLIEDEILHWWEMAQTYKRIERRAPGLYGSEPRGYFDSEADDLRRDLEIGPEAVAERVRGLYRLPSLLRMPRADLIARYEAPLRERERDLTTYRSFKAVRIAVPFEYQFRPYDPPFPPPFRKLPPTATERSLEEYFRRIMTHKRHPPQWKAPEEAAGPGRAWIWVPEEEAVGWEREAALYRGRVAFLKDDDAYQALRDYFRGKLHAIGVKP